MPQNRRSGMVNCEQTAKEIVDSMKLSSDCNTDLKCRIGNSHLPNDGLSAIKRPPRRPSPNTCRALSMRLPFKNPLSPISQNLVAATLTFTPMWYAFIVRDTSQVNKFYEPLSKLKQDTCQSYLIYAKKFHPEAARSQSNPTPHSE